jgi:hypothetical protein
MSETKKKPTRLEVLEQIVKPSVMMSLLWKEGTDAKAYTNKRMADIQDMQDEICALKFKKLLGVPDA